MQQGVEDGHTTVWKARQTLVLLSEAGRVGRAWLLDDLISPQ
jgi:hypothetical protein